MSSICEGKAETGTLCSLSGPEVERLEECHDRGPWRRLRLREYGEWLAAVSGLGAKCTFKLLNVSRGNKTKQTINSAFTVHPQFLASTPSQPHLSI